MTIPSHSSEPNSALLLYLRALDDFLRCINIISSSVSSSSSGSMLLELRFVPMTLLFVA